VLLAVRDFWVDGEGRDWPDDPHADDGGYYVVLGVDLVGAVEGFDPDGILVWVPELSSFGTWDSDHWDLIVFEATPLEAIVADPVPFLDAQWDPTCPFDYLRPWTLGFEWRNGRPFWTLSRPAEDGITSHDARVVRYPLTDGGRRSPVT
jgi:hypothetical protein